MTLKKQTRDVSVKVMVSFGREALALLAEEEARLLRAGAAPSQVTRSALIEAAVLKAYGPRR